MNNTGVHLKIEMCKNRNDHTTAAVFSVQRNA